MARSTIEPNSSGEANWPLTSTIAEICCAELLGSTPMLPEATWAFCALIALVASSAVSWKPTRRSGSIQTRSARSVE